MEDIKRAAGNREYEIILVDSGTDRTADIAKEHGAKVFRVDFKGYGNQLRYGLSKAKGEIIVISDCDRTYPLLDLQRFLEKIEQGYDLVTGNRILYTSRNIPALNVLANRFFSALLRVIYGFQVEDISTGMKVFTKEVNGSICWESDCELPVEMLIKPILKGFKVVEIPIHYMERVGGSSKLKRLHMGWRYVAFIFACRKYKKQSRH